MHKCRSNMNPITSDIIASGTGLFTHFCGISNFASVKDLNTSSTTGQYGYEESGIRNITPLLISGNLCLMFPAKWNSCNCKFLKERPKPAESLSWVAPAPGITSTHSVSGAARTSSQKSHRSDREVFASVWDCAFDTRANPITSSSYPLSLLFPTLLCWRMKSVSDTVSYISVLLTWAQAVVLCCTKCRRYCLLTAVSSLRTCSARADLLIAANSLHLISRPAQKPREQWKKTNANVNSISACIIWRADEAVVSRIHATGTCHYAFRNQERYYHHLFRESHCGLPFKKSSKNVVCSFHPWPL